MRRTTKPKKTRGGKRIQYELLGDGTVVGRPMYERLARIRAAHHEALGEARIALAWCKSWKPDVDGIRTIGKCKKASDLDRELAPFDFIILLNQTYWQDLLTTDAHKDALLDHELCHAQVALDERTGDPKRDERKRLVFRTRKHDIEEFGCIIERHGLYKRDLERAFSAAVNRTAKEPFAPCDACRESPGFIAVLDGERPTVRRCVCYLAWVARRQEAKAS